MQSTPSKPDSVTTYLLIYAALMALLIATMIAAIFDLGRWNIVAALLIAVVKALLVILFFMHVRQSSKLTKIFAAAAFLWLALLLFLTMSDYATRDSSAQKSYSQIKVLDIPK